jgi:hypothetical protein
MDNQVLDSKEVNDEKEEQVLGEIYKHENGQDYKWIEIPYWPEDAPKDAQFTREELPIKKIKLFDSIKPERLEGETRHEYVVRRALTNQALKARKKGQPFWNSAAWGSLTPQRAMEVMNYIKEQQNQE